MAFDRLDRLVALEPFPQALQVDSADRPGAAAWADHRIEVWMRGVNVDDVAIEAYAANQRIRVPALGQCRGLFSRIIEVFLCLRLRRLLLVAALEHDIHLGISVGHR